MRLASNASEMTDFWSHSILSRGSVVDGMNERAKELYTIYDGSTFHMGREGVYDEYKRYNVSLEQEAEWRAELVALWISRLSPHDFEPVFRLWQLCAKEALLPLLDFADQGDDHIRLVRANALWAIAVCYDSRYAIQSTPEIERLAMRAAIHVWKSIVDASVVHVANPDFKPYDGSKAEDFIRAWARTNLEGVPTGKVRL